MIRKLILNKKGKKSYKETMNIDIENINTILKRHKHYTKRWRTIYEVIQQELFDETDFSGCIFKTL